MPDTSQALPIVAIVGRPNVGKSTLFNRLTRTRDAIVADMPGLTRDRHYGKGRVGERPYWVIDTGGFEPLTNDGIKVAMAQQAEQAIAEADCVLFLVDGRAGVQYDDQRIAQYIRKLGKSCLLVINKAEGMRNSPQLAEFSELGLGDYATISASHGDGVNALMEHVLALLPAAPEEDADPNANLRIKLAIVGRPNVGKSTLVNTLLGEERVIAFDQPGTTRDAIEIAFEQAGQSYTLIDTAGLRKRGKVFESVEKLSVVKTMQAIEHCNVALLLLDATQEISDQDAHIAGFALEAGRAMVVAINKWDAVSAYQRSQLLEQYQVKLPFLSFAQCLNISAAKRQGIKPMLEAVQQAHACAFRKLPTPQLTRALQDAVEKQQPPRAGAFRPKLRYAHQGGQNPPVIIIHGNSLDHLTKSYLRYLEGHFCHVFKLRGTPLRIQTKISQNIFDPKRVSPRPPRAK